jgi:hypothetical protein
MIVGADEVGNLIITLDDGRVLTISDKEIITVDTTTDIDSLFILPDDPDFEVTQ